MTKITCTRDGSCIVVRDEHGAAEFIVIEYHNESAACCAFPIIFSTLKEAVSLRIRKQDVTFCDDGAENYALLEEDEYRDEHGVARKFDYFKGVDDYDFPCRKPNYEYAYVTEESLPKCRTLGYRIVDPILECGGYLRYYAKTLPDGTQVVFHPMIRQVLVKILRKQL